MKKRFAHFDAGEYRQIQVNEDYFSGYVCFSKFDNIQKPVIVNDGERSICIIDNNYEWLQVYPDNGNYAMTVAFNDKHELIEWYFDIAKSIGLENDIPYEEDLYLDMVITPGGKYIMLDEDELLQALEEGIITKEEVDAAYKTFDMLKEKYVDGFEFLKKVTNNLSNKIGSDNFV